MTGGELVVCRNVHIKYSWVNVLMYVNVHYIVVAVRYISLLFMCVSLVVWCDGQTDEDPNLGKEWFHGSISREEVLDLLTHSEATGVYVHVCRYCYWSVCL